MKRLSTFAILLFATLTAASVAAAPPSMRIELTISPARTLPGLSVPLLLHIRNGASAVQLTSAVRVRVTSPAGETFLAKWYPQVETGQLEFGLSIDDEPDEDADLLKLPANATVDLSVPAVDFTQESWAHDGRLVSMPGTWKLEVLLFDLRTETWFVSTPATLQIEMPPPADVWIWQEMLRSHWAEVAVKVLAERPESPYFPYLSTFVARLSTLEKIDIINRAITLHPQSPVVPYLRSAIASYYGMESERVDAVEKDLEKAVALAEKGRTELMRLKNSKDPWSRLAATRILTDGYPDREYFVALKKLMDEQLRKHPPKPPR